MGPSALAACVGPWFWDEGSEAPSNLHLQPMIYGSLYLAEQRKGTTVC